eukprot:scaffold907_cov120-Isochrysis_galbana.AAC.7
MFATVHAAGSSLLGLFTSCTTFDSTRVSWCRMSYVYVSARRGVVNREPVDSLTLGPLGQCGGAEWRRLLNKAKTPTIDFGHI